MAEKSSNSRGSTASTDVQMQELFLPVHGYVNLYPEEIAIIDHPSFQRLRRVRQLGFTHIVFPGGTHTRLEHSIGTVHVAQMIIDHVNANFRRPQAGANTGDWHIAEIDDNLARLIRLGALLHDIGHLPFGHTLEDELNHLPPHDGPERLEKIATKSFGHYDLDKSVCGQPKPAGGWSLKELINTLYGTVTKSLRIDLEPFLVLCAIICKPPKLDETKKDKWTRTKKTLEQKISLQVCRDIVGNTICADFLDYLFRDWHHLGKSLYEDKRLYQYMEVRTKANSVNGPISRFVINAGAAEKVRHDAFTNILELLEGRYKLGETILFHRTKLAITALLDRCLLEIRDLYQQVGIPDEDFLGNLEELLLNGSDDELPNILMRLAEGGSVEGVVKLREKIESDRKKIGDEAVKTIGATPDLLTAGSDEKVTDFTKTEIENQIETIKFLASRVKDRCVYTLAYKIKISDFTGAHNPENPKLVKLIALYRIPKNRRDFLRGIEALCNLPECSLVMYCPPDAAMNAKIAKVNLLIEGQVTPFDDYDKGGEDSSLTGGALWAQIRRFYQLWSAQGYIDRLTWDSLSSSGRQNLRAVIKEFFFQMRPDIDVGIVREQVQASIVAVQADRPMAARDQSAALELDKFADSTFPSRLPFALPSKAK